jgi:Tfp pilus assembly protein PilF
MKNNHFWLFLWVCACFITLGACNSNETTETYNADSSGNISAAKNTVDSFAVYEKALALDSLNIDLRNALAAKYYSADDYERAEFHYSKVCNVDKKNLLALTGLGNIFYDTKQFKKAIEYYQKALSIDEKNTNVRCDMATCYLNINLPGKALIILKENLAIDYNHAQSHHNLSVVYQKLGKQKEADEEMRIYNNLSN